MTKPHFQPDQQDSLLTTREAAQRMGVSLRTIQLWVDGGHLQAGRTPGGHRRIRASEVARLAERSGIKFIETTEPSQPQADLQRQADVMRGALGALLEVARREGFGETTAAHRAVIALGGAA